MLDKASKDKLSNSKRMLNPDEVKACHRSSPSMARTYAWFWRPVADGAGGKGAELELDELADPVEEEIAETIASSEGLVLSRLATSSNHLSRSLSGPGSCTSSAC